MLCLYCNGCLNDLRHNRGFTVIDQLVAIVDLIGVAGKSSRARDRYFCLTNTLYSTTM
jgi:hypothetical protein